MKMKAAVIVYPGSNCDHDSLRMIQELLGQEAVAVWHQETELPEVDLVWLPGGFSYGDYLRSGAIARFSPIMPAVVERARAGGLTLGICNGFQTLCEAGLVQGALQRNQSLRFLSQDVYLRVERCDTPYTLAYDKDQVLRVPIANGDGRFYAPPDMLQEIEDAGRVVFRYCDRDGNVDATDPKWNPNGSLNAIAGLLNPEGNVLGLMPHPERGAEALLGNEDGYAFFASIVKHLERRKAS